MASHMMFSESDLNSPGYEYLRSHRNMNNLYLKLVALNYQRDFCLRYKCPSIHKYYFSTPSGNPNEQLFIFMCLCAWLIKDKCQMNLDLSPEDYQDIDATIGTIFEALKLLLLLDNEQDQKSVASVISFAPARLKRGFGPEVIWTICVLADRALELYVEAAPGLGKAQIIYHEKQLGPDQQQQQSARNSHGAASSITIGQPIVGGGLTTRPLGNYHIEDSSLLLAEETCEESLGERQQQRRRRSSSGLAERNEAGAPTGAGAGGDDASRAIEWRLRVERNEATLRDATAELIGAAGKGPSVMVATAAAAAADQHDDHDWRDRLQAARSTRKALAEFLKHSGPLFEIIANRIEQQMRLVKGRERALQTSLGAQLDDFLKHWRHYSEQSRRHAKLMEQVGSKTDLFEAHAAQLRLIGRQIEERTRELNDGTKLRALQATVDALESENRELDLRVNLLLMVYANKRSRER